MLYSLVFLLFFLVPVGALCWRLIVSKTRQQWIRVGAAGAAMLSAVGAFVVYDDLTDFTFKDWRGDIALVAAMTGSIYQLLWSRRKGDRRHRTISIIAAVIGLVPVAGTIATAVLFGGEHP
jgi:peptidoglycan/LPS O-acetylase OafA/YrhL